MSDLGAVTAGLSIALVCAFLFWTSVILIIFWFWFLCRMTGNDGQNNSQQGDLKVQDHQCEEGCGRSYSVDRNVIKISCPALALKEVNELFL